MTRSSFAFSHARRLAILLAIPLFGCTNELPTNTESEEDLLATDNGLGTSNGLSTKRERSFRVACARKKVRESSRLLRAATCASRSTRSRRSSEPSSTRK